MVRKNKSQEQIVHQTIMIFLLLLLTFVVTLSLNSNPFSNLLPVHDSSMFQYFGYAMDKGKTMYTEIFDHKGPMIFVINYIGTILSTPQFHGIYFMEFISLFVYFFFSYKTINLWLTKTLSFITVIPQGIILMDYLEKGNLTEEYALPFIAISLYIFSKYFIDAKSINYFEVIFLGFASAVVFSLRANMVVVWLAFSLVIFLRLLVAKEYKTLFKYIFSFLGGLLLFFLPMGVYLYMNGALEAAIFQSLTFNIVYLDNTSNPTDAILKLYTSLNNNFVIILFAAFLAYMVFNWRKADRNEKYFYVGVLLFSIGSYASSALSGRSYMHYLMTMIPVMTLPTALLLQKITNKVSKYQVAIVAIVFIGLVYYPQIKDNFKAAYTINTPIEQIDVEELEQAEENDDEFLPQKRQIAKKAKQKEQTMEVAKIIQENSQPSDAIYAHKLAGNLYLLSDRLSSIKYFNLPSVNINENEMIGEDFLSDIIQSETELIIVSSNFNKSKKIGTEKEFFDYVTNNYDLIYDQNGYSIYKMLP